MDEETCEDCGSGDANYEVFPLTSGEDVWLCEPCYEERLMGL